MTLITFQDGKPLMKDDGKIGTGQECCCEDPTCLGCFVDFTGSFNWTFTADNCNGNAVNMAGTIVDGFDFSGELAVFCTQDSVCFGDPSVAGLFLSIFNGSCGWREAVPGGVEQHPCSTARTLPGTYTLRQCSTGETGTLVIQ